MTEAVKERPAGRAAPNGGGELLETVAACPLCGGESLAPIPTANLNSRDPERVTQLEAALGSDFFVRQELSLCDRCGHLFQSRRPVPEALRRMYEAFSSTVAKIVPSSDNMYEYLLRHNSKDYVGMNADNIAFLDEHGLLEGVDAALEIRTYGGGLPAVLAERGVGWSEAAAIQRFDAEMAERVFGLERISSFNFYEPLERFRPLRDRYDLIVTTEGLTHAPDPRALLGWLHEHLSDGGRVVLFREPDTPAFRYYHPLAVTFNNFHLQLFNEDTLRRIVAADGRFSMTVHRHRHPGFERPIYLTPVLTRGGAPPTPPEDGGRYDRSFYLSWSRRDASPARRRAWGVRKKADRVLGRLPAPARRLAGGA